MKLMKLSLINAFTIYNAFPVKCHKSDLQRSQRDLKVTILIVEVNFYASMTKHRSSRRMCFVRRGVLRKLAKFTGKYLCQSLPFNKAASPATLLKKRLWHR